MDLCSHALAVRPRALRPSLPRLLASCALVLAVLLTVTVPAGAIPPGAQARGFVEGANHHLGDASFVARFGRAPGPGDSEALRMHVHLAYVRAWLAARPASRPELAPRRARLLGYLDEYIAAGTTPENRHVPWRNPVFVDDAGRVCAVGYLIERSAGRALVERIAAAHRDDYLEDIDAAMREVHAWVADSGFTLTELASIQPGYIAQIDQWESWDALDAQPPDGPWSRAYEGTTTRGAFRSGAMEGRWVRTDARGRVLGVGRFRRGSGAWQSRYPSGARLAEGGFARNHPDGPWRFYHPSGNLAAEGAFRRGARHGEWRFYQDAPAPVPIAAGAFERGQLVGRWRHFDAAGAPIAESWTAPAPRGVREPLDGNAIRFAPTPEGLTHESHQNGSTGDFHRLDAVALGGEQLFVQWDNGRVVYDAAGRRLTRGRDGAWRAADCHWTARGLAAAARGDLALLHNLLIAAGGSRCGRSEPVAPARAAAIDAVFAALDTVRVRTPDFVRALAPRRAGGGGDRARAWDPMAHERRADFTEVLANNMSWYVEWPHVDGRFNQVFATLPDHYARGALTTEPSTDHAM